MTDNEELPSDRNKTDEALKDILSELDDKELKALQFGMVSTDKFEEHNLTSKDTARLMELNEEENDNKHF